MLTVRNCDVKPLDVYLSKNKKMSLSKVQSKLFTTNDQMVVEPKSAKGKAVKAISSFSKTPVKKIEKVPRKSRMETSFDKSANQTH